MTPAPMPSVWLILRLGSAQTLAWASSYYLAAMLAEPMARDLGVATSTVFAAFSAALVVSAFWGPYAGRCIDRWGGRPVLAGTSGVFAAGLLTLAMAGGPVGLFVGWGLLGVGMGSGLYEAGFAALVRLFGHGARGAITGITLLGGFASTIGWPLSTLLEHLYGWRGACLAWAALHLVVGLPLNLSLPRAAPLHDPAHTSETAADPPAASAGPAAPHAAATALSPSAAARAGAMLAVTFAATWFISTAMGAHLPRLLQASGTTLATAVGVSALVGAAQVGGRLLEFGLLRHVHPLVSARGAALLHPLGAGLLLTLGAPAAAAFTVLHGVGNGILTIAKGTLPLALFGAHGYGQRQGLLMVPARIAQAAAPWLFGLCLDRWGAGALWLSGSVGLLAFGALLALPKPSPAAPSLSSASAAPGSEAGPPTAPSRP